MKVTTIIAFGVLCGFSASASVAVENRDTSAPIRVVHGTGGVNTNYTYSKFEGPTAEHTPRLNDCTTQIANVICLLQRILDTQNKDRRPGG